MSNSVPGMSFSPLGGILNMMDPAGVGVKGFFQPKPPSIPAMPAAATVADPLVTPAQTTTQNNAALAQGYGSTIITGGQGDTSTPAVQKKQLLGQ